MKFLIKAMLVATAISATSCTVIKGRPAEQVKRFDDWRLCAELGDFTYRYNSEWIWNISKEIEARNLTENEGCKAVYMQRIRERLLRARVSAEPPTFKDALKNYGPQPMR